MTDHWFGIAGQQQVKKILDSVLASGKIPNAFIFAGPSGIGKDFVAVRFAHLLNLLPAGLPLPADTARLNHFNEPIVKFIFPMPVGKSETNDDGPFDKLTSADYELILEEIAAKNANPYHQMSIPRANDVKINSIRDINRFLSLSHPEARYKTIIISNADEMSDYAQNALLKNLEEPPENTVFILTVTNLNKLRETTRSRCWLINFSPLSREELAWVLESTFLVPRQGFAPVLPFAEGSLTTALEYIELDIPAIKNDVIVFLRYAFGSRLYAATSEIVSRVSADSRVMGVFLRLLQCWFTDLERFRNGMPLAYFAEFPEVFQKFNARYPGVAVAAVLRYLERLLYFYANNNLNLNIVMHNMFQQLSALVKTNGTEALSSLQL